MMNYLSCFVIGDLFEIVVIVSVDYPLPVNMLPATAGVIWRRHLLDVWLLLSGAFCFQADPVTGDSRFHYGNVVDAPRAPARTTGFSHFGGVRIIIDSGATIRALGGLVYLRHGATLFSGGSFAASECRITFYPSCCLKTETTRNAK